MKQISVSRRQTLFPAASLLAALIIAMFLFSGQSYAAKNKVLKARFSFTGVKYGDLIKNPQDINRMYDLVKNNSYAMGAVCKKDITLTKTMKISGRFYIPKKAVNKKDTLISVLPALTCDKKAGQDAFAVVGKYAISLYNEAGKIKIGVYDANNKSVKKGKMVSLTKTKEYYIIQVKNFPLDKKTSKNGVIPTKGKFTTSVLFATIGIGKKFKGTFYLDDLALKAKKETKINFDTKDYKKIYAFELMNSEHRVPVKRVILK